MNLTSKSSSVTLLSGHRANGNALAYFLAESNFSTKRNPIAEPLAAW
jgi:hypothetical protein